MKIIANIATTGDRSEHLKRAVDSLIKQVDRINIYDNSKMPDLADNGKFYFLQFQEKPVYYLTCDDKIRYPSDYAQRLVDAIEKHQCIVTYHGRKLVRNQRSFYKGNHKEYHFLGDVHQPAIVDVPGTGVMGFRTDYFNPENLWSSPDKRMVDLLFGLEAKKEKKKIICDVHSRIWLKSVYLRNSISVKMTKPGANESRQVELMKIILNE